MRVFYIFKIKDDIKKITFNNSYDLFHTLETIYFQMNDDISGSFLFLKQLIDPIKVKDLDILLFQNYKENYFYMKYKNMHKMHDVYRQEKTTLMLYKTHLKLETNVVKPRFLEILKKEKNLFICDFLELDYFWLEQLDMKTGVDFISNM